MHASVTSGRRAGFGFAAAVLAMFMAQLDGMAVAAALPALATDLGADLTGDGLGGIAGVTAAYLVTVTVTTPLHGRLGDRYGRRAALLASIGVFALGSVACAIAPTLPLLVLARALQGVGAGGLIVGATSAMGELYAKAELLTRQGWLTAVSAVSLLGGPLVGGLLADGPGWQWIFVLNLPVGALACALGWIGLPNVRHGGGGALDWPGSALIALGGGGLVVLGSSPAADPVWTVVLAGVACACAVALVPVERRAAAPLLAPAVFADPGLRRSILAMVGVGLGIYGTMGFVPLLVADVTGQGGAGIGAFLVVMNVGSLAVGVSFAVLARRWSRMVPWGRLGLLLGAAGLALLAAAPALGPAALVAGLACYGIAFSLVTSAFTVLAQTRATPATMGTTMGALLFVRQAGGALATAAYGWLATAAAGGSALVTIFVAATVLVVGGLAAAPRRADE